jgi:predicted helicase
MLDFGTDGEVIDGYRKIDNVTDDALTQFQAAYPSDPLTKDDIFFYIYGLLHSSEYRETYAADLKKMLPRIPFVRDFRAFADAGRKLSDLHLNYESVPRHPLTGLDVNPPDGADPYEFFAVGNKKISFGGKGKNKDKTVLEYNRQITLGGIPEEAYRYTLGARSAIEWLIDRYYVKTDKDSGIVNNPNDWSREVGDPRYIIELFARITTVSLETMVIVDNLPPLANHE